MALPFATNAACFALGRGDSIARIVATLAAERIGEPTSLRREMAEGIRWLVAHPPMRTLALTIFAFNVTFGAAWSRARAVRGRATWHGAVGFGLLTTAIAIGGHRRDVAYGRAGAPVLARRHHARSGC